MKNTRKIVLLAILVAQALILSIIESALPIPQIAQGVKLGLANIVTMITIVLLGPREAFVVVAVRCLLASFFGGGPIVFFFSISGGILSTVVMVILYKTMSRVLSIIGISIAGAVAHNIGQIIAAALVMRELAVAAYLPILLVSGIIMGCFVGICSNLLVKALRKTGLFPNK